MQKLVDSQISDLKKIYGNVVVIAGKWKVQVSFPVSLGIYVGEEWQMCFYSLMVYGSMLMERKMDLPFLKSYVRGL